MLAQAYHPLFPVSGLCAVLVGGQIRRFKKEIVRVLYEIKPRKKYAQISVSFNVVLYFAFLVS